MLGSIPAGAADTYHNSSFRALFLALLKYKRDKRRLLYYDGTYSCECRFNSYIEHLSKLLVFTLAMNINKNRLTFLRLGKLLFQQEYK